MTQARITATLATACLLVGCSATAQQVPRTESQEEYNVGQGGIVSKRIDSPYRSGPSKTWLKSKNPASEAVRREAEEDWG